MNGRRTFTDVAKELRDIRPGVKGTGQDQWQTCVNAVGRAFCGLNQRFDETKFRIDCGYFLPVMDVAALQAREGEENHALQIDPLAS